MRIKISLPELRRVSELLVDSVVRGIKTDVRLRDRMLQEVQNEVNRRGRRALGLVAWDTTKNVLRRTGHKGV